MEFCTHWKQKNFILHQIQSIFDVADHKLKGLHIQFQKRIKTKSVPYLQVRFQLWHYGHWKIG